MSARILWAILGIGLLLAAAYFFISGFERVAEPRYRPPRADVTSDPFHAAREWLAVLQWRSTRLGSLERLRRLGPAVVVLVPKGRSKVTSLAIDEARRFVQAGGHLIIEAESRWAEHDLLLEAFGIDRAEGHDGSEEGSYRDPDYAKWTEGYDIRDHTMVQVRWRGGQPALNVRLAGYLSLKAARPLWLIRSHYGIQALQLRHGKGLVTAVSDLSFATNNQIGRNDHAEFLWQLIHMGGDKRQVAFFRGERPNLLAWIWNNARIAVLALGVWIALWLWHAMPRLGSLLPDPPPVRRRLLDHLAASGRFWWSAGHRAALMEMAAQAAKQAVERRYPHLTTLPVHQQAQFLERQLRLPRATIEALYRTGYEKPQLADLLRLTRACQLVHRQLSQQTGNNPPSLLAR